MGSIGEFAFGPARHVALLRVVRPISLLAIVALLGVAAASDDQRIATARSFVQHGDDEMALVELAPVLKHDPKNVPARIVAAAACLGLQDPDAVDAHLKVVHDVAPDTPGYQLLRGRALLLHADTARAKGDAKAQVSFAKQAVEAFTKAQAESPGRPATLALLAMAQRAAKQTDEAAAAYGAWIAAAPRDPSAYGATAAFLAEAGQWDRVDAVLASAPQDDPHLAHRIRVAVLSNGALVVPWPTIEPLYDSVVAEETDSTARRGLEVYKTIRTTTGTARDLAILDYLDANPDDPARIAREFLESPRDGKPVSEADAKDDTLPVLIKEPSIHYPDVARRARLEGKVILICRIRVDGTVGSIHVLSTSNPMFNDEAIASLQRRVYKPATLDGKPIEVPFTVRTDFRLR